MKIPKILGDLTSLRTAPGWVPMEADGRPQRPIVRCRCGRLVGLARHTVHVDGRVTASFLHPSCGFHEFLELEGYDGPEFFPESRS